MQTVPILMTMVCESTLMYFGGLDFQKILETNTVTNKIK